jgi:hypothetical protein
MKLPPQDRLFFQIMNYQYFQNNQVNLYAFFFLGMKVETKIRNTEKLQIIKFRINEVLLYLILSEHT